MVTLVIGGAASGKSEYAEFLAEHTGLPLTYIATMQAPDDESRRKVQKHVDRRAGKGYETIECPHAGALAAFAGESPFGTILLDDFGNLVSNTLFPPKAEYTGEPERFSEAEVEAYVRNLAEPLKVLGQKASTLVLVTNDLFSDAGAFPPEPGTDNYMRVLAKLNIEIAAFADNVCEVIAGCPNYVKGGEQA